MKKISEMLSKAKFMFKQRNYGRLEQKANIITHEISSYQKIDLRIVDMQEMMNEQAMLL